MTDRETPRPQFTEDAFDLEKTKRGMSAFALAKKQTKKAHLLIKIGRMVLMVVSLGVFLLLFYLAMDILMRF